MSNIVINGNAYSDDGSASRDMRGGGHESWLLPMLSDTMTEVAAAAGSASDAADSATAADASATAASNYAAALIATSTSSVAIGTGSKTFATQTGKQFTPGAWAIAIDQANPANWLTGTITSYAAGSLVVNAVATGGSGTITAWTLVVSGARGADGPAGTGLPSYGVGDALRLMGINAAGNATAWQTMPLRNIQIFTSGGTFTPDANNLSNKYLVMLVAGGGSGARSGSAAPARGGQSGGHVFGVMQIDSDQTITIGGGGASVSVDSTNGNNGSDSSIGSLAVAKGGMGGGESSTTGVQSSATGTTPAGCISSPGQAAPEPGGSNGVGGASVLGNAVWSAANTDQPAGIYGAGGSGARSSKTSGAGGDGICVIIW